ncbi:hypothetical protein NE237_027812 [Protea cynaroides]|uniref:Uncharacterized protein n=1 Tax=Protea cynaroides TaxID=273540 RepID=A0A9Q0GR75_9MAGN|nr:hypothetical protein NE237_027812 [Protea cynaroides]
MIYSITKKHPRNLTDMLHRYKRYVAANGTVAAKQKRIACRTSDKKRSDQLDKSTKAGEKNKKPKFEKETTGKIRYPKPPAYPDQKAYHPLNKPVSEIMHIKRNDPLMVRPPPMYTQPHERNLKIFCHHHNEHGYYTNDCQHLQALTTDNINNDYWEEFVDNSEIQFMMTRGADSPQLPWGQTLKSD